MDAKIVFPTTLFILIFLFENSSSLQCFQCNSDDHAGCEDPFSHSLAGRYLYNCPTTSGKKYFCEKFVYKYDGEPRVQRRCQHIRKEQTEGCHITPFDSGSAVICECDGNGCNFGSHLQVSLIAILSAAVFVYLRR